MYLMSYVNNKGADQSAHPCSLISAFVFRCVDNISRFYSRNLKTLASFCVCVGRFVSGLVGNSRRHVLSCRGSCLFISFDVKFIRQTRKRVGMMRPGRAILRFLVKPNKLDVKRHLNGILFILQYFPTLKTSKFVLETWN